jgi:hypothetical protein
VRLERQAAVLGTPRNVYKILFGKLEDLVGTAGNPA